MDSKEATNTSKSTELHVFMFPWFAFGHISPFVELSNKLSSHGIKISFLSAPGNIPRIKTMLNFSANSPNMVQIIPLPIPHIDGLPPGLDSTAELTPAMHELLKQALDLMKPEIKTLLAQLKPHFIFFDFAHHWLPALAAGLNIKTLFFSVFSTISNSYFMVPAREYNNRIPTIDELKKPPCGYPETSFSSLKTYEAQDFLYLFKKFGNYSVFDRVLAGLKDCSALVMKTCNEMEGKYVKFIETQLKKTVLLTGPLAPKFPQDQLDDKWASWLSNFPSKSVVFCSFGSETFLKDDQIKELALGLELSGLPFILVLNFPADVDSTVELTRALPKGFLERVQDRGVVHTGWVQQRLILAHPSVGCYVCHSGYSSMIEAIINDCQLVLLPLKGDQFLNSKLISGDMKAGVEVKRRDDDGYFGKDDVCEAIRDVMGEVENEPGKTIRANQNEWKDFLLNEEAQNNLIFDLVGNMKTMV